MASLLRTVTAALVAIAAAVVAAMLVQLVLELVGRVAPDLAPVWPFARGGLFGAHPLVAWAIGAPPAACAAIARLLLWPAPIRSTLARAGVAAAGIAAIAVAAIAAIGWRELPSGLVYDAPEQAVAALAGAACLALAAGRIRPPSDAAPALRFALAAVALAAIAALAAPTLAAAAEDARAPGMAADRLELIAAYPYDPAGTGAVVSDGSGEVGDVITFQGHRYNLHRDDRLVLGPDDVVNVRWRDSGDGAYLAVLVRGDARAALRARGIHRMSQYDAFAIAGDVVSVALVEAVMDGRLFLHEPDRTRAADIYRRLVHAEPP
jgi:hypothetical protein